VAVDSALSVQGGSGSSEASHPSPRLPPLKELSLLISELSLSCCLTGCLNLVLELVLVLVLFLLLFLLLLLWLMLILLLSRQWPL
jgi:hypothetical protein